MRPVLAPPLLVLALLAGCPDLSLEAGSHACRDAAPRCPSGQTCSGGTCVRGATPDAAVDAEAEVTCAADPAVTIVSSAFAPALGVAGASLGLAYLQADGSGGYDAAFCLLDSKGKSGGCTNLGKSAGPVQVVSGPTEFGLAWFDDSSPPSTVWFTRYDPGSGLLGSPRKVVSGQVGNLAMAWSASDGYAIIYSVYEAAYSTDNPRYDLHFARLSGLGAILSTRVFAGVPGISEIGIDLAPTRGASYVMAWGSVPTIYDNYRPLLLSWLDSSGQRAKSLQDRVVEPYYGSPAVLNSQEAALAMAWVSRTEGSSDLMFNLFDDGQGALRSPRRVNEARGSILYGGFDMAWSGTAHGLAWQRCDAGDFDLRFRQLDSKGHLQGAELVVKAKNAAVPRDCLSMYAPTLAWTGLGWALVWMTENSGLGFSTVRCK